MRTTEVVPGRACGGFAYLLLLFWLAIGGALLCALATHWSFESRREREREFVFRAEQYRHAIEAYAAPIGVNGCSNLAQLPTRVQDLVEDRRCGLVRHHLRRLYDDPITGTGDWGLVAGPAGILGVYSASDRVPIRHVEGVRTYRDWRFVANAPAAGGAPGG